MTIDPFSVTWVICIDETRDGVLRRATQDEVDWLVVNLKAGPYIRADIDLVDPSPVLSSQPKGVQ